MDLPVRLAFEFGRTLPTVRSAYPPASPLRFMRSWVALEFPPVVHRLRIQCLGLGPGLP